MAAEPGTEWNPGFSVTRNELVNVPVRGRKCTLSGGWRGHFFSNGISKESVEVMVKFGYKLKQRDIEEAVSHDAIRH